MLALLLLLLLLLLLEFSYTKELLLILYTFINC